MVIFKISLVLLSIATASFANAASTVASACQSDLMSGSFYSSLFSFRENVTNGKEFRATKQVVPGVLTLRIKKFFFDKILSGEKVFEYRVRSKTNDALINSAIRRGASALRLHFQDNDVQLLAEIQSIDKIPGDQAVEPWDIERGIKPSTLPHWRIAIRNPKLIWRNEKSLQTAKDLNLNLDRVF